MLPGAGPDQAPGGLCSQCRASADGGGSQSHSLGHSRGPVSSSLSDAGRQSPQAVSLPAQPRDAASALRSQISHGSSDTHLQCTFPSSGPVVRSSPQGGTRVPKGRAAVPSEQSVKGPRRRACEKMCLPDEREAGGSGRGAGEEGANMASGSAWLGLRGCTKGAQDGRLERQTGPKRNGLTKNSDSFHLKARGATAREQHVRCVGPSKSQGPPDRKNGKFFSGFLTSRPHLASGDPPSLVQPTWGGRGLALMDTHADRPSMPTGLLPASRGLEPEYELQCGLKDTDMVSKTTLPPRNPLLCKIGKLVDDVHSLIFTMFQITQRRLAL